jgi:tetratricopeptide (TPR) repeat protein
MAHIDAAVASLERAMELNPSYGAGHVILGDLLVALGRTDEARRHYLLGSRLDSTLSHAELGLGQIEMAAGRYDAALARLTEALRRNPSHTEAHQALAQVYLALGDADMARYHADLTRELPKTTVVSDPRSTRVLAPAGSQASFLMAVHLMDAGRLDEAEERLEQSIRIDPRQSDPHVKLGELLLLGGRFDEAVVPLREALRMNASDVEVLEMLAAALAHEGELIEAATHLRTVLKIDPTRAESRRRLDEIGAENRP